MFVEVGMVQYFVEVGMAHYYQLRPHMVGVGLVVPRLG